MSQITINHRHTGAVLFTHETTDERQASGLAMRDALEAAVSARANLSWADLSGANLSGANLSGADLSGAKWRDGITLTRAPLQLFGLAYTVHILDAHMQIGCELHALSEWREFDDARIVAMDGKTALKFWRAHKAALLALAESDGRGVVATAQEAA